MAQVATTCALVPVGVSCRTVLVVHVFAAGTIGHVLARLRIKGWLCTLNNVRCAWWVKTRFCLNPCSHNIAYSEQPIVILKLWPTHLAGSCAFAAGSYFLPGCSQPWPEVGEARALNQDDSRRLLPSLPFLVLVAGAGCCCCWCWCW
jgi:hypothetical protein